MQRSRPRAGKSPPVSDLSLAQARRIALAAQGFTDPPARGTVDRRLLRRVLGRIGLVQIDSVNVLVRAHYLPLFSRLGTYPSALLERAAYGRDRIFFEYWGHEVSLLPLPLHPLLRWRMARAARGIGTWGRVARVVREEPELLARLRAEIAARGPLPASAFDDARGGGTWWGWSDVNRRLAAATAGATALLNDREELVEVRSADLFTQDRGVRDLHCLEVRVVLGPVGRDQREADCSPRSANSYQRRLMPAASAISRGVTGFPIASIRRTCPSSAGIAGSMRER